MSLLIAPLECLVDDRLTDPERRVLLALFSFRGKDTNTVWPGLEAIAERALVKDTARVSKLTSSLAKKGWLTKKKRGFTGTNKYILTVPDVANLDAEPNLEADTNLVSDTKLESAANLAPDASSNLAPETKSNLAPDAKYKEQTTEQTSEQTTSCAEPAGSAPPASDDSPVILRMPTNRFERYGEEFPFTQRQLDQFAELYPAVDILQAARKACGWLIADKRRRKTMGGMAKFLNNWFAKEQDRGGSAQGARPAPARQSTRHASLEEDLGDTSWATPAPAPEPASVASRPVAQLAPAPQGGGFKVLPKLQDAISDVDPEGVIYRCGTKLLVAAGKTPEESGPLLRSMLGKHKAGRLLEAVLVGMAGRYTDLVWLDTVATGKATEIPKDWAPSAATLASLSAQGLPEELHARSRAAFLAWFGWSEIRCADWDDLFTRMCLIEWARADGSATQYTQTLAAAAAVGSQHAWQEPA